MNVLYITVEPPYPLDNGGAVAVFNRARELTRHGHQVRLLCPVTRSINATALGALRACCSEVWLYRMSRTRIIANVLRHPWMPFRTARRYHPAMRRDIARLLCGRAVDVLVVEHSNMTVYFTPGDRTYARSVVVFEALVHQSFARDAQGLPWWDLRKAVFLLESWKTKAFERTIVQSALFDEYWFYSEGELRVALGWSRALRDRARFVPVGVEVRREWGGAAPAVPGLSARDPVILLVGSMDNPSNEDAARWFAGAIFPAVRQQVPAARFLIVGRAADRKLGDLAGDSVIVVPDAPDLAPYLYRCQVYVVPQRGGGGVKVKLLDGLSARRVVVSTEIGTEAIEGLRPGEHYLLARDAEEFARTVVGVLEDPARFLHVAENGHRFLQARFSVEAAGTAAERFLADLCLSSPNGAATAAGAGRVS